MTKELWIALLQQNPSEMAMICAITIVCSILFAVCVAALVGSSWVKEEEAWID